MITFQIHKLSLDYHCRECFREYKTHNGLRLHWQSCHVRPTSAPSSSLGKRYRDQQVGRGSISAQPRPFARVESSLESDDAEFWSPFLMVSEVASLSSGTLLVFSGASVVVGWSPSSEGGGSEFSGMVALLSVCVSSDSGAEVRDDSGGLTLLRRIPSCSKFIETRAFSTSASWHPQINAVVVPSGR